VRETKGRSGFRAKEAPYSASDEKAGIDHKHWPIEAQQSDRLRTSAIQHQQPLARRKRLQSSQEARASDTYRIASVIRIANESGAVAVTQLSRLVTRTRFKRTRSDVFGCPAPSNSRLQGMSFYS
jgi:G3E family GTPase